MLIVEGKPDAKDYILSQVCRDSFVATRKVFSLVDPFYRPSLSYQIHYKETPPPIILQPSL